MDEFEKMASGRLYNPADPKLDAYHLQRMALCQQLNQTSILDQQTVERLKTELIPSSKGKSLGLFLPFYCEYGSNIHVGKECFINYHCTFLDVAPVTLGDNVWLGSGVTIATPCHPFLPKERLAAQYPDGYHDLEYAKPVTIEPNCWICANATITGGVTIGAGSIVAAGAVVTKDVPANSLVAGVPARVLRQLDEKDRLDVWQTYQQGEIPRSLREKERD
ncbi:sugar O-acetyltransferase [Limosilactobacillus mucosae]|uniref:sugar O-acetyltransferase n=1 Tax=Limosilactobacillus mucosae TaxID=97478 RepID=UPI00233F46D7|nr:sugar O-acetyltransferase [Limosilactobacillus mucosae]MDC2843764.1 sugar O-acetyltransferase [Limosilactobacillus mucosae]